MAQFPYVLSVQQAACDCAHLHSTLLIQLPQSEECIKKMLSTTRPTAMLDLQDTTRLLNAGQTLSMGGREHESRIIVGCMCRDHAKICISGKGMPEVQAELEPECKGSSAQGVLPGKHALATSLQSQCRHLCAARRSALWRDAARVLASESSWSRAAW